MANYAAELNRTASTSLSLGSLCADATTPRRAKLFDLIVGSEASPADNAFLLQVQRCTTQGTGSAVTPQALDPADAAGLDDVLENHSVDPTLTANAILLAQAFNQRAGMRWAAVPGSEIVIPATANNGLAVRTPTSSAVAISATIFYQEQ